MLSAEQKGDPTGSVAISDVAIPFGRVGAKDVVKFRVQAVSNTSAWAVDKRFSAFEALYDSLKRFSDKFPQGTDLPPKKLKLFTSHVSVQFIETRRALLENFLKKLLSVPQVAASAEMVGFLTSDKVVTDEVVTIVDEKTRIENELPDDVEITAVSVPSTRTMTDHILYQVLVENRRQHQSYSKWSFLKRYSAFTQMDIELRKAHAGNPTLLAALPTLPAKEIKLFTNHMGENFVEKRRVLLENYLRNMMKHVEIVHTPEFLSFLGVQ
jgi:hypothetical protein